MPNTLTVGGTTVTLPEDTQWVNEFAWSPVAQRTAYSITGALIVDAAAKVAGRQMTIVASVLARTAVQQLEVWRAVPGQTMVLVHNGVTHNVKFDHEAGALEATPFIDYSDPVDSDICSVVLRFLKV
jgi:hypothetical protein